MTRSEAYASWDVVAVPFPYTDRLAEKRRPALVVSSPALASKRGLLWLVMITSADNPRWDGDVAIADLETAGLPAASVVRPAKIAVIDAERVARKLGRLEKKLRNAVAESLHALIAKP